MTSIQKEPKKIKYLRVILLTVLILLGILAAFILGRLSMLQNPPQTLFTIEKAACPIPAEISEKQANSYGSSNNDESSMGAFVASKNGTKFYPVDCSYADRIGEVNRVWFETEEDAQMAGYEASTQCSS